MSPTEIEELFLKSLDQQLTESEKQKLADALNENHLLATELNKYGAIRQELVRKQPDTFGPYFAQKVMMRIQNVRDEVDNQIAFFFRRFQLAAVAVVITLFVVNVAFSDRVDINSILGIQEASVDESAPEDDIETFDFLETLASE